MDGQEPKKLYRSIRDRKLLGLCGGIAEYFDVDATIIRLIAILGICFTCGTTVLAYIIAALVVPEEL